jgi:hypothetical protein
MCLFNALFHRYKRVCTSDEEDAIPCRPLLSYNKPINFRQLRRGNDELNPTSNGGSMVIKIHIDDTTQLFKEGAEHNSKDLAEGVASMLGKGCASKTMSWVEDYRLI